MADAPIQTKDLSGWGIYALAARQDPYSAWDEVRARSPVLDAGEGVHLVTSWALVDQALRDHSLLAGRGVAESLDHGNPPPIDAPALWLMSLDGPPHTRARDLVRRPFAARRVAALRPAIESIARARVGPFADACRHEAVDFYHEVSLAVPSEVMRTLFEVPAETWQHEVHRHFLPDSQSDSAAIMGALVRFFASIDRPTGLYRALLEPDEDGNALSRDEAIANAVLMVMAGIDTTAGLIANTIHSLIRSPEVLAELRADSSRCAEAVEETLRFEPPALSCSRYVPAETQLGGVRIPADSHLLLCLGAANRDPERYDSPNRYRLGRDLAGLSTFGGGRHFCLGAALARLEARVVLEEMLRVPAVFEVAAPVVWRTDNPTVRLPEALNLRCRAEERG